MRLRFESRIGAAELVELSVNPMTDVLEMRELVGQELHLRPDSFRFVKDGEVLPFDHSLKELGIQDGDKIVVIPNSPGMWG